MSDILHRLSHGPDGHGWSCETDDEFETISDAIGEIKALRAQLTAAQNLNAIMRQLADKLELGEEE